MVWLLWPQGEQSTLTRQGMAFVHNLARHGSNRHATFLGRLATIHYSSKALPSESDTMMDVRESKSDNQAIANALGRLVSCVTR